MMLFLGDYVFKIRFYKFVRKCWNCKIEKPRSQFNKDHTRFGGIQYECKTCQSLRALKRLKGQPEITVPKSALQTVRTLERKMNKVEKVIRL